MSTDPARIQSWYLHRRRICESIGADALALAGVSEEVEEGHVCTLHRSFYSKGLPRFLALSPEKRKVSAPPFLYTNISLDSGEHRVEIPFYPDHLTSASSHRELSGRNRLFVLGNVASSGEASSVIRPWAIGSVVQSLGTEADAIISFSWKFFREVHPAQIDQFRDIENVEWPKAGDLKLLQSLPEHRVKTSIAEIIGEPEVQKDWGGERSDLYSTRVTIKGRPLSAAFAFKGPGCKRKQMTLATLGRNGDQISRLFSEPAELLVLQHWGTFHRGVVDHMRAHANQIHAPRYYMLMDGYTTLALLRAYSKV